MTKASPPVILMCVLATVILTWIVSGKILDYLIEDYRVAKRIPPVRYETKPFLFFDGRVWYEKATIRFGDLDARRKTIQVGGTLVFPFISIALGFISAKIASCCCQEINSIFNLEGDAVIPKWDKDAHMLAAALWPITILATILGIIAIIFGGFFRLFVD